jgi:hypothetical protein
LIYILVWTFISAALFVIQNELQYFHLWLAYFTMFGFGVLDNCVNVYGSIVFGFEFDSKIMAAAARNFLWAFVTAISLGGLSIWPPTN